MGVYVYTMRAEVREIDGVKIGQFKFAHKPFRGWDAPKGFELAANAQINAGENAKRANRDIQLFIASDWKVSPGEKLPVLSIPNAPGAAYDDLLFNGPVAGHVFKVGRKWKFEAIGA